MAFEEEEAGIPEWVVTFGDMMSLLLTFFVLLFSMSEIKQEESVALIESLRRQFGNETATLSFISGHFPATPSALNKLASLGRARRKDLMRGGDKVQAPVGENPRVMAVRPSDDSTRGGVIHFDEGSSELTDPERKTVRAIADLIGGKPQMIEVRGHTSTRPLSPDSPYRNHWDLAYARASEVTVYLVQLGINPKRIRISVAAENEPIHDGYDQVLQKKNARVEISMLNELFEEVEASDGRRPSES